MFDQIEKLKLDLTDKYVVVDAGIPELARFGGHVGQVKTVNMNGRALVEFDAWSNIGWYDIDVECLTVVPKPEVPPEGRKHEAPKAAAAKPAVAAGEKKLSPLEMARMQGAAKGGATTPAGAPVADKPAPAKAVPAAGAKRSTADILAAARAKKPDEAPAAEAKSAQAVKEAPQPAATTAPASAQAKAPAAKPAVGSGQRLSLSEILAWCRQHDAK